MSFLFSGLLRLNVQSAVGFENAEINFQESFTLKCEQLTVRVAQPQVGEQDNEIEIGMFTKNQNFVANSEKKYYLENVIHFLPKVVYWFRPNYAVQIAARYTVKMLSGE